MIDGPGRVIDLLQRVDGIPTCIPSPAVSRLYLLEWSGEFEHSAATHPGKIEGIHPFSTLFHFALMMCDVGRMVVKTPAVLDSGCRIIPSHLELGHG